METKSTSVSPLIVYFFGMCVGIAGYHIAITGSKDTKTPPTGDDGVEYFTLPIKHEGSWICPYNP